MGGDYSLVFPPFLLGWRRRRGREEEDFEETTDGGHQSLPHSVQ